MELAPRSKAKLGKDKVEMVADRPMRNVELFTYLAIG